MPCLMAHRGQLATFPENTLESVQAAIRCGAPAVEFDVQMTADFTPVICHDDSLYRTSGIDVSITASNYEQIRDICVGEPSRFASRYHSVTLPSLRAMVNTLKDTPQVKVFVELKDESIEAFGLDEFLQPVIHEIEPIRQHCVVIADNLQAIMAVKNRFDIPVGWIVHRWHQDDRLKAKQCAVDYLIINHKYYDAQQQHDFTNDDWDWVMYEINDASMALSLYAMGICYVETADICSLLQQTAAQEK